MQTNCLSVMRHECEELWNVLHFKGIPLGWNNTDLVLFAILVNSCKEKRILIFLASCTFVLETD